MIYTIKSKSKNLNFKRIKFFFTWFKIPIKLIPINLKWSIAMICYNKPAKNFCLYQIRYQIRLILWTMVKKRDLVPQYTITIYLHINNHIIFKQREESKYIYIFTWLGFYFKFALFLFHSLSFSLFLVLSLFHVLFVKTDSL